MSSIVVVYLASPSESMSLEIPSVSRLDCLEASLKLVFKFLPSLPVIVFHENYTDSDRVRVLSANPNVSFELVDFSGHQEFYTDRNAPGNRVNTYGYGMMCRFFSGVMQAHSALEGYTHYMRLDDDSYIVSQVSGELLSRMLEYDYVYSSVQSHPQKEIYQFTMDFMREESLTSRYGYSAGYPYTNFHVSSLALWRHPIIRKFSDSIEKRHSYLRTDWSDASMQGMVIWALCPSLGLKVLHEPAFDYRHNQHCLHHGRPHTKYCSDRFNSPPCWGPPVV
jgi:hypothetical protein